MTRRGFFWAGQLLDLWTFILIVFIVGSVGESNPIIVWFFALGGTVVGLVVTILLKITAIYWFDLMIQISIGKGRKAFSWLFLLGGFIGFIGGFTNLYGLVYGLGGF